ncbi:MAG: exonuclease SbcC [Bacteriovoracaceae bacterium]
MRIQSIEIENITSLRGKHQINLAESLQGEELFAITGPTGSGKSSLLSAISLALYGRTYKGSLSANDFVTTGEAFAMSSIEFTLGGKKYSAKWSIKTLKKNGDPIKNPKPSREILCEGTALENANTSEILGLDFDQFCKTIILNQGQFAEFLHSSFKERKDIIEKLYRTGELSELGKILKEKIKKEEHELELTMAHFDKALPYTEEEIKKIKAELNENQELLETHEELTKLFSPAFTDLNHLYQKLKEEDEYQKKVNHSKVNLERLTNAWNESKKNQLNLKKAYDNAKAKSTTESPKLREAIKHKTNLDNSQKQLLGLDQDLKQANESLTESKKIISDKKNQLDEVSSKLIKLQNSYTNKKLFLEKTNNEIYSFKEDLLKLKQYAEEIKKNRTEHGLFQAQVEKIALEVTKKNKELETKNIDNYDLVSGGAVLDQLRREREASLDLFNQLERESNELSKLIQDNLDTSIKLTESKESFQHCSTKLENFYLKIENEKLSQAIDECSEEARKNGECPVCKNTELSSLKDPSSVTKISKEGLKELEAEVSKLKFQREADDKRIELNTSKIHLILEKINKIALNLFKDLKNKILWQSPSEVELGIKILKEMQQENLGLNLKKQEGLQKLTSLKIEVTGLESNLKKNTAETRRLNSELEKINHLVELFMNNWKEILPRTMEPASVLLEFDKDLEVFNQNIQFKQKEESLKETLSIESTRSLELGKKIEVDQKLKEELDKQISELKKSLEEICKGMNPIELLEELEKTERRTQTRFQNASDEFTTIEKQKTAEEQSLRIYIEQIDDLQNLQNSYIKRLKTIFKELSLYSDKIPETYPLYSSVHDVFKSSAKWIDLPQGTTSLELLPIIESRLESTWNELNEKISEVSLDLKTSVQTNKSRIVEYNQKLEGRASLEEALTKLKKSLDVKKRLADVFGKDEFRSYALGLLEEELVMGANSELDELCDGRYQLKLLPGRGGQMEFFVSDQWRESILRKIDTLSGGETFLASLAMALALAELTRGQNEIDSFFIDEGFGHLDGDSIEEVLEVLMNIQNRGKQIGIISHVKALTDRIPVNLTLQKTSLGESTTEFIYN